MCRQSCESREKEQRDSLVEGGYHQRPNQRRSTAVCSVVRSMSSAKQRASYSSTKCQVTDGRYVSRRQQGRCQGYLISLISSRLIRALTHKLLGRQKRLSHRICSESPRNSTAKEKNERTPTNREKNPGQQHPTRASDDAHRLTHKQRHTDNGQRTSRCANHAVSARGSAQAAGAASLAEYSRRTLSASLVLESSALWSWRRPMSSLLSISSNMPVILPASSGCELTGGVSNPYQTYRNGRANVRLT
jgi:hypothetical protein